MSLYFSLPPHHCLGLFAIWDGKENTSSSFCPARQQNHWLASKEGKKKTNQKRTEVRGHLGGMKGHSLTLNLLCSSYSNKIPNILPLHLQSIEFSSDEQLVVKKPFHGGRRVRKSFFVFRKKPSLLFELLPSTLIKKGLSSSFKCIHFMLESVSFSKLTQLDQNLELALETEH